DPDSQLARGGKDFGLDVAGGERVLDLQIDDRVHGSRPPERLRPDLGQADVTDVPGLDQVGERPDDLLDVRARWHARRQVDVDVVGVQRLKRVGEEVPDRHRPQVDAGEVALRVAERSELHRDHYLVAPAAANGLADQDLVVARAVEVSGVDEGDAL